MKMYYIEAATGDSMQDALINNTLVHDKAGKVFGTMEECFDALDDFIERKGFDLKQFNVDSKEVAA